MKILIFLLLPFSVLGQTIVQDSTVIPIENNSFIRFTTPRVYTQWSNLDSLRGRSTSSKGATLVSPYDLPISTATTTALDLKANTTGQTFTGSIGYATGGTVTQTGNKTNAVTLNKQSGQITMAGSALAAAAEVSFTLNNSFIGADDVVIVNIKSVGTAGAYFVTVGSVSAGSCTITVGNVSTGSLSQAVVLSFAIIKGSIN